MSDADERLLAAVAAGVLPGEEQFGRLLHSIVEVARAIFGARAASVLLFDEDSDELVFAAVAGDGEQDLVGRRLPSSTGIAGWVLSSRTPLVLEDVQSDPRFDRTAASKTGFVPRGLMAVPLLDEELVLGVLQVLDRPERERFSLREMDLLGLFASQAAIALSLQRTARRARTTLTGDEDVAVVARIAALFDQLDGPRREAARALLVALEDVLGNE